MLMKKQTSPAKTRAVSARERAEEALCESEERVRSILANVVDGIVTIDDHGIIDSVNPATERIFGYRATEMLGQSVAMLMPVPYDEKHDGYLTNYLRTGKARIIGIGREVSGRHQDGTVFPMHLAVSEFRLGGRHRFVGLIRDITERRRMEAEIQKASEMERQRIGRDLHDGLGQSLTAMGYLANAVLAELTRQSRPEAAAVANLARQIEKAVRQTHEMARGLFPVELKTGGIVAALQELAATTTDLFHVRCRFSVLSAVSIADDNVARQLYRIAQEAVSNAIKHSHGRRIMIRLRQDHGHITLTVRDNGIGIHKRKLRKTDMGLHIMQYRADMIGATLGIDSARGRGTIVTCSLPALRGNHRRAGRNVPL